MASSTYPDGSPRTVDDTEYELLGSAWSADGIVGIPADTSPVYGDGASGLAVKFRAGKHGLVHGHGWSSGTSDISKAIGANSSGQPRIDLAVLGLDRSTWLVTEYVKAGTPASTPVPPTLLRDAMGTGTGKWEIPVATISVVSGASAISAGDVTTVAAYLGPSQILYVANTTVRDQIPNPVNGQIAYVASAAAAGHPLYHYITGTGWRRLDWNNSWGIVGGTRYPGAGFFAYVYPAGFTDTTLRTGSVNLLAGRRYTVELSGPLGSSATADVNSYSQFELRKAGVAVVDPIADDQRPAWGTWLCQILFEYQPAADESIDFELWGKAVKTTGTTLNWSAFTRSSHTYLRVRDNGPASLITAG